MSDTIKKIKSHMDSIGLSPYKLSKDHGFPKSSLSDWFTGKAVPGIDSVEKLCSVLGLELRFVTAKKQKE